MCWTNSGDNTSDSNFEPRRVPEKQPKPLDGDGKLPLGTGYGGCYHDTYSPSSEGTVPLLWAMFLRCALLSSEAHTKLRRCTRSTDSRPL